MKFGGNESEIAGILTEDRKNPNGCPIKATFYVSHQYTNYRDVQYLWNAGHEIAIHSISYVYRGFTFFINIQSDST